MDFDNVDFNDPASVFAGLGGPGGLPIPEMDSPDEARREAQASSKSVLDNWNELKDILGRHEATIQNRWLKKGRRQKLMVLLEAWPDMPEHHRPDFFAFRKESPAQRERATAYRDSYLWPYINQQDLSKPRILLLYLNARKTHPSAFAASDGEAMHMGKINKAIVPLFLNQYTFVLNGVSDTSQYGRLLSWDDHPEAFDWMARRVQFLPEKDSLFLKPSRRSHVGVEGGSGYFHDQVSRTSEHRQEKIEDYRARQYPIFQNHREHVFWHRVVGGVVTETYLGLAVYDELLQQVRRLQALQLKYAAQIKTDQNLPDEYCNALLKFRHYLLQAIKGPLSQLKQHAVASPQLRRFCVRGPPSDPDSPIIRVTASNLRKNSTQEQLIWLLQTLWEDGNNLFLCRLPIVVDELQRLIDTDQEAASFVSDYIKNILGNLSITTVCLSELEGSQPWSNSFEYQFEEHRDNIMQEFAQNTREWAKLLNVFGKPGQSNLEELGSPTGGNFDYPVSQRRTKENVDQMRRAEAHLDAFWTQLDRKAPDLSRTVVGRPLSKPRSLQRTPEWTPPSTSQGRPPLEDLTQTMSEHHLAGSHEAGGRQFQPAKQRKEKTKTWGTPHADPAGEIDNAPVEEPPQPLKPIEVDSRALKVFRTLFFNPSATATPGEVAWSDFLHALVSLDFKAEKLYGSKWQFVPPASASWPGGVMDRPIQFHESHPGKIPFNVARRHGRRLQRAYGWSLGSFALRSKESSS